MDELVDILNEEGDYTGMQRMKSEAHRKGLFHPTVHVWLYTRNGRLLIQKRGRYKKSFPLLWDVSVAGHIGAGEDIVESALREVEEEIGLKLQSNALTKVGVFKSKKDHADNFKDYEFHHSYIAELQVPFDSLKKQDSEVEELALVPIIQFAEETWGLGKPKKYVPHDPVYYQTVIGRIREELKRSDKFRGLA